MAVYKPSWKQNRKFLAMAFHHSALHGQIPGFLEHLRCSVPPSHTQWESSCLRNICVHNIHHVLRYLRWQHGACEHNSHFWHTNSPNRHAGQDSSPRHLFQLKMTDDKQTLQMVKYLQTRNRHLRILQNDTKNIWKSENNKYAWSEWRPRASRDQFMSGLGVGFPAEEWEPGLGCGSLGEGSGLKQGSRCGLAFPQEPNEMHKTYRHQSFNSGNTFAQIWQFRFWNSWMHFWVFIHNDETSNDPHASQCSYMQKTSA